MAMRRGFELIVIHTLGKRGKEEVLECEDETKAISTG